MMSRIILKTPFMRHYEGSVFDLEESINRDRDDFFQEKISPQKGYYLPDDGKGSPIHLPKSDTVLCPPSLFEGMVLTTGPCRITSAKAFDLESEWGENKVFLSENKDGLHITDQFMATRLAVFDRKNKGIIQEKIISTTTLFLGFPKLLPGFYEIKIFSNNDILYSITFIKCYPLVLLYDPKTGHYTTKKTIW